MVRSVIYGSMDTYNRESAKGTSLCSFLNTFTDCWDRNGKCVDNTVLLADDKTEGIFYAEFDMEAIREYRNREMLGNTFRKVESYSRLLSKEIKEPFIRDGQNR